MKSFFLFGARATGKTTLIKSQFPDVPIVDLLDSSQYGDLLRRPKLVEERVQKAKNSSNLIIIDEIQKLPILLDEVHRLMNEHPKLRFLLTGSSARKLKRGAANLLAGRAWEARLYPLTWFEINTEFDLTHFLNRGGLPSVFDSKYPHEELKNYTNLYLREEVAAEALTRSVDSFAKFLDLIALQNGEELNFSGMASDSGIHAKTLQNYIQILEDTLLGFQLPAYRKTLTRKAITRSKFYLFDLGITNHLAKRGEILPKSELFGKAFEHFLLLEIFAYRSYRRIEIPLSYWRSTSQFEVDCIIGSEWALEFKATDMVHEKHLKGLKALQEEKQIKQYGVVSNDPEERIVDGIKIIPWKVFLKKLWMNELL